MQPIEYITKCLQGAINLDGMYPQIKPIKCGAYLYSFQKRPKDQLFEMTIVWNRTTEYKRKRTKVKKLLARLFDAGDIVSYTFTNSKLTVNWFQPYVKPNRIQLQRMPDRIHKPTKRPKPKALDVHTDMYKKQLSGWTYWKYGDEPHNMHK